ncbi:hypothetical protein TFLX_02771 [Thermoflexales bacterium]|nr:hypothetical protein TFLX_02771 [Thermoflexales bacterium]
MPKKLFLAGFALWLNLAACAPVTAPSPRATPRPSPLVSPLAEQTTSQEISVIYHRSGGFAGLDDTWKISTSGAVWHEGQTTGTSGQLTTAQLAELKAAVHAANFMSLTESYVPKDTCCDRYLHEITVTQEGQSKTVRTIDASPTAPAELVHLIDVLNRLVATSMSEVK